MGLLKQVTLNDFDLDANFSSEEEVLNVQGGTSTKTLSRITGVTPSVAGKIYKTSCIVYNTWSEDSRCHNKTTWSENC